MSILLADSKEERRRVLIEGVKTKLGVATSRKRELMAEAW